MNPSNNIALKNIDIICFKREESDGIKGILIILIVAAHNTFLTPTSGDLQHFIYFFHVAIFFILPFFYRKKHPITWKDFVNSWIRTWVPYSIFFLFSTIVYYGFIRHEIPDFVRCLEAFLFANQGRLKEATGFHFLWFLPAYCIMSCCRDVLIRLSKRNKMILSFVLLLWSSLSCIESPWRDFFYYFTPLGIPYGLFYAGLGVATWICAQWMAKASTLQHWSRSCLILLFGVCAMLYFKLQISWFYQLILPIDCFLLLYSFRAKIGKCSWLQALGKQSLGIYLLHVYLYNVFVIISRNWIIPDIVKGVIVVVFTLAIAWGGLELVSRNCPRLMRWVFPRGLLHKNEGAF